VGSAPETLAVALAAAVLLGGAAQALVLLPAVLATGLAPRLRLAGFSPAALRTVGRALPSAFAVSLLQLTGFANVWFAARLPPGSHSYLYLADRIFELPLSLIGASIAASILPVLARDWAAGERAALGSALNGALRLCLFLAALNAVGMLTLAGPIVDALFVGREFSLAEGVETAKLIEIYGVALLFAALARVLMQGLFAANQAGFAAASALASGICHVVLAGPLIDVFGLPGLALATCASQAVHGVLLTIGLRSRVTSVHFRPFVRSAVRIALSAAAAAAASRVYLPLSIRVGPSFPRLAALLVTIACVSLVYFATAAAFRSPELRDIWRGLLRRRTDGGSARI
jgi:putative peptidoglycan lipid II flippase